MARIFISYRSADGADKATALARDLGRAFGDAQVFLDKDDLTGGLDWSEEVRRTLGGRPVLLLVVTPGLLAVQADGRRLIDDPQTPVRHEVAAALAAGATVLPLLADGVEALPADLPAPLDTLGERTWRRLRAYDWDEDVQRVVQDLRALGVPAAGTARRRRVLSLAAGAAGAAALAAAGAWWWLRPPPDPFAGRFEARLGDDPPFGLTIVRDGETLRLEGEPIDIRTRADWAEYRAFWRERFQVDLDQVRMRGEGTLVEGALDLGFTIIALPSAEKVDGGNLTVRPRPDGALAGTRWLNGAQAETPALLLRR